MYGAIAYEDMRQRVLAGHVVNDDLYMLLVTQVPDITNFFDYRFDFHRAAIFH